MSPDAGLSELARPRYREWLRGSLIFLAVLVIARLVLEAAGVPHTTTRFFSSNAALFLAAVYLGAVAPLRGETRLVQLIVPAIALAVWSQLWVILATVLTGVFRLERSHFLAAEELGNWGAMGGHLVGHVIEIGIFSVLGFILMAIVFTLRRWPVTVGPGACLGALVILRFWTEAMGLPPANTAAWSSTVGVIASAFYLGAIGSRFGLNTGRQLFVPAMVLGWTWRVWILLATLLSALLPFYKTHFFDPSQGEVAWTLLRFVAGGVLVEGLIAGLLVWGIAVWISRATRPSA